jgi:hypothetical protein
VSLKQRENARKHLDTNPNYVFECEISLALCELRLPFFLLSATSTYHESTLTTMLASRQYLCVARRRVIAPLGARSLAAVNSSPVDKRVKQNNWEANNFINYKKTSKNLAIIRQSLKNRPHICWEDSLLPFGRPPWPGSHSN